MLFSEPSGTEEFFLFLPQYKEQRMRTRPFLWIILMLAALSSKAQTNTENNAVSIFSFDISYGLDLPGADLQQRFGLSNSLGGGFQYKSISNWLVSFSVDYLFGNNIKIADDLLDEIATQEGYVIDEGGIFTDVAMEESGVTVQLSAGRLFPVLGPNKNSGLVVKAGFGYMRHQIRFGQTENSAPQISGDYAKGYDRLTDGLQVSEFIGYQYFGNENLLNFYVGLEFHQGFTHPLRAYNFDEMKRPENNRTDLLSGIKAGWVIPLGKQNARKIYSY